MENNSEELDINEFAVSVGDWFVTMLIMAIPLLNLIMLLVWAFADEVKPSKRNFARAALIMFIIFIAAVALFVVTVGHKILHMLI